MRWAIAVGGVSVIAAVLLIFFYLLWVVFPLFLPAETRLVDERDLPAWGSSKTIYLSVEEQQEVGLRLSTSAQAEFFDVATGQPRKSVTLPLRGTVPVLAAEAVERHGLVALASDSGAVLLLQHRYETRFPGGVESREILPEMEFPYGDAPMLEMGDRVLVGLAVSDNGNAVLIAGAGRDGLVRVNRAGKTENLLSGEVRADFFQDPRHVRGSHDGNDLFARSLGNVMGHVGVALVNHDPLDRRQQIGHLF